MYSSFHAVVGGFIMAASPNPVVGASLAFASHFVVDYLGESSVGDTKTSSIIEGLLLLIYMIGAWATGAFWVYILAWAMSNLPDLIDKPRRWFLGKEEWFSCHNGKGLFQHKGFKLGYPVRVRFTKDETLALNVTATLIWFMACTILR